MKQNKIKKSYIYLCRTILLLAIYVLFFPIISIPIKKLFPSFGICPYLSLTGNPCPLCGGTRYLENLGQALKDWHYLVCPFGFMIIFVLFEIVFRIIILIVYRKNEQKKINKNLIIVDIIIHVIAVISFLIYEITFLQRY